MQNLFRKLKRDIDKAAFVSCINMEATIKKKTKKKLFLLIFLDVQLEKVEQNTKCTFNDHNSKYIIIWNAANLTIKDVSG